MSEEMTMSNFGNHKLNINLNINQRSDRDMFAIIPLATPYMQIFEGVPPDATLAKAYREIAAKMGLTV